MKYVKKPVPGTVEAIAQSEGVAIIKSWYNLAKNGKLTETKPVVAKGVDANAFWAVLDDMKLVKSDEQVYGELIQAWRGELVKCYYGPKAFSKRA